MLTPGNPLPYQELMGVCVCVCCHPDSGSDVCVCGGGGGACASPTRCVSPRLRGTLTAVSDLNKHVLSLVVMGATLLSLTTLNVLTQPAQFSFIACLMRSGRILICH